MNKYHEDEIEKELAYHQAWQYLDMIKKFSPLEEHLLQKRDELLDRIEEVL